MWANICGCILLVCLLCFICIVLYWVNWEILASFNINNTNRCLQLCYYHRTVRWFILSVPYSRLLGTLQLLWNCSESSTIMCTNCVTTLKKHDTIWSVMASNVKIQLWIVFNKKLLARKEVIHCFICSIWYSACGPASSLFLMPNMSYVRLHIRWLNKKILYALLSTRKVCVRSDLVASTTKLSSPAFFFRVLDHAVV